MAAMILPVRPEHNIQEMYNSWDWNPSTESSSRNIYWKNITGSECVHWTTAANIGLYTHWVPMLGKC